MATPDPAGWLEGQSRAPIPPGGPAALEVESLHPPRSIIVITGGWVALAASQTDKRALRPLDTVGFETLPDVMAYRGSVVAMAFKSTGNKTAGVATFRVAKNGVALGPSLAWPNGVSKATAKFAPGTYPFAEADEIQPRVTTDGSYAPSASNYILLDVYLLIDPSVI